MDIVPQFSACSLARFRHSFAPMNRAIILLAGLALTAGGEGAAVAKVDAAEDTHLAVSTELDIAASPQALWAVMVVPTRWWSGEHSWSGDARNFWMTVRPGGCFCETLPVSKGRKARGFVEHARVIYADPTSLLRLSGVFGPLQSEALTGTMSLTIKPGGDGKTSKLHMTYSVVGYSRIPLKPVAPVVDKVLAEQMQRLKAAAESSAR